MFLNILSLQSDNKQFQHIFLDLQSKREKKKPLTLVLTFAKKKFPLCPAWKYAMHPSFSTHSPTTQPLVQTHHPCGTTHPVLLLQHQQHQKENLYSPLCLVSFEWLWGPAEAAAASLPARAQSGEGSRFSRRGRFMVVEVTSGAVTRWWVSGSQQ